MPEVVCSRTNPMARGGNLRRFSPLILLLAPLIFTACADDPVETDPLIDYVRSARLLRLDSGTPEEHLLRGDSLRQFLDRFRRDTFAPGPRSVRIESDCRPGSITIGKREYPVALCTVWSGPHRPVLSIGLDTAVVRLIQQP